MSDSQVTTVLPDETLTKQTELQHKLAQSGTIQTVLFAALYRQDNVRTAATERVPEMVASYRQQGFVKSHPLMLSAKSDGRYLVIRGNRRCLGLEYLAQNDPAAFAAILPTGEVPAIVYFGLTEAEEILLRADHAKAEDRVPLDDEGEFLTVCQLVRAGYASEAAIADKMGKFHEKGKNIGSPNRSWIQPRVALAKMPGFVQAEFRKLWRDGTGVTAVRVNMILPLVKVFREEFQYYPDGNGPQFTAEWAKAVGKVHVKRKPLPVITPSAALDKAETVGSRNLREALKIIGGKPANRPDGQPFTLADVDAACFAAEAAQTTLVEIADLIGEAEFASLVKDAREAAELKAAEIVADDSVDSADDAASEAEELTAREIQEITA